MNQPKAKYNIIILTILAWTIAVGFLAWAWLSSTSSFEYHANPTAQIGTAATTEMNIEPIMATVTAYTLSPDECDQDYYIGAYNDNLFELSKTTQICASNAYPKGTKLKVGDFACVVMDKMNSRYPDRIDLLFPDKKSAREWGRREVEIIKL